MLDRLRALIEEKAAEMAHHDGVPVALRHVHGAANEVTALIHRARDAAMSEFRPRSRAIVAHPNADGVHTFGPEAIGAELQITERRHVRPDRRETQHPLPASQPERRSGTERRIVR